jgi:hypothetical protein
MLYIYVFIGYHKYVYIHRKSWLYARALGPIQFDNNSILSK